MFEDIFYFRKKFELKDKRGLTLSQILILLKNEAAKYGI